MKMIEPTIPIIPHVKKAIKINTVTLRQLSMALAERHGVAKGQMNAILTDMVASSIAKHLKKGSRMRIPGLGTLQVRKRPARMGRNPGTGEAIKDKASKKIAFRGAKGLKAAVMSLTMRR
jgi:DNA-binding protein HU-beta